MPYAICHMPYAICLMCTPKSNVGALVQALRHLENSQILDTFIKFLDTFIKFKLFASLSSVAVRTPKKLPNRVQNPHLGWSWGALRAPVGRPWALFGRPWALLGRYWVPLGRSWLLLGRPWGLLGRSWTLLVRPWARWRRSWAVSGRLSSRGRRQRRSLQIRHRAAGTRERGRLLLMLLSQPRTIS